MPADAHCQRPSNRVLVAVLMAAAFCCALTAVVRAQDAAKGAALLAEARAAVGGDDRLRAVKTLDVRGDFKRMAGQTTIEGELQVRMELPDKLRRDEDLTPPGAGPAILRTEVLNGTTVWDETTGRGGFFVGRFGGGGGRGAAAGAGPAEPDPAQVEDAQRRARQTDLTRFVLVWLLATDQPVAWIATAEAPDGKADVLEITPAAGPATRLFLDQATHMPLMITWQGAAQFIAVGRRGARGGGREGGRGDAAAAPRPEAQPATFQMTLGEYKTVNGIKLPHLITRAMNNMPVEEWAIDSYRINPSFRGSVFTK